MMPEEELEAFVRRMETRSREGNAPQMTPDEVETFARLAEASSGISCSPRPCYRCGALAEAAPGGTVSGGDFDIKSLVLCARCRGLSVRDSKAFFRGPWVRTKD